MTFIFRLYQKVIFYDNKMNSAVSILSKIPNLGNELRIAVPQLVFKEITEHDKSQLSHSDIIIADFDLLINDLDLIKQPKWIQSTWAGVDKFIPYFTHDKFHSTIISRFSGQHFGRLMSEYVVSHIINHERNFFEIYENKKQNIWSQTGKISEHRSIADLTIGILGVGQIGNYIARTLHYFGAKIWGFGRKETLPNDEEYQHYNQYCTKTSLPELLNNCDYIVNVLPSTDETKGLLNGGILQNCSGKETVLLNIGRGSIISEEDLLEALRRKWLSVAILDVFEDEPLPKHSALWNCDQVFITPHVAGVSRAKDIAEQFAENLKLYQCGQSIPTQLYLENSY